MIGLTPRRRLAAERLDCHTKFLIVYRAESPLPNKRIYNFNRPFVAVLCKVAAVKRGVLRVRRKFVFKYFVYAVALRCAGKYFRKIRFYFIACTVKRFNRAFGNRFGVFG